MDCNAADQPWERVGKASFSPAAPEKTYLFSGVCEFQGHRYFVQLFHSKDGGLQGPIKRFPKEQKKEPISFATGNLGRVARGHAFSLAKDQLK